MRHLLTLLCVLLIVTLTASVAAIAYGRQQPALMHAQSREFEVCDNHPCFWDIVPGVTSLDAAGEKVSEFVVMEARRGRMPFVLSWLAVRGNLYWDEQSRVVTGIGLSIPQPDSPNTLPTLLELVLLYGEPCAVQAYSQSVMLIFPHVWVNFPREHRLLTLASRPETLVYENVNSNLCVPTSALSYPRQSWQGVAAFDHYHVSR
jgi:hypothetical protein